MTTKSTKNAIVLGAGAVLGVAGAVVITTASPSQAMPVLSNTAAVRAAASNQVTDVRHYRRCYYGRCYYRRGYYGRGYYGGGYGYPYWGYPYPYAYSYPYPFGYGWGGWGW